MKTDDLIDLLATRAPPAPRRAAARVLRIALLVAVPVSFAAMLLALGIRPDLARVIDMPMFWVKLLFPASVAALAFAWAERMGRPGMPWRAWARAAWLPFVLIALMGGVGWLSSEPAGRPALVLGQTWRTCMLNIVLLSLPVLAASLTAMKALAPTRPGLAGAAAGLLAGGAGATVYALHCPELAAPFLAVWYSGGIGLMSLAGAALGARWLRW